jgi:hypothetical protein
MSLDGEGSWHRVRATIAAVVRHAGPSRRPTRRLTARVVLGALLGIGHPPGAMAQQASPTLEQYLGRMGIEAQQRAAAARGKAVARLMPTKDDRDVTVFGVIGLNIPADTVAARALDIERLLAARGSRFHVFGTSPSAADVRDIAFDESEYRGLRNCRSGDCDFKLSTSAMKGFVDEVDWSSRAAKSQADERLRAAVLRLVTDYVSRGDAAMPTYDDAARDVHSADVFAALLAQTSDLYEHAPELQRYLATYPADRPDGARDVLYWSEERLPHLRPTLTVNHIVVYAPPAHSASAAFIARKQLYASHYFEGAFELLAVVGVGAAAGQPRSYLLTMRRFRFDALPGGLFNIRGRVRRQLVDATRADLERQRASLQQTSAP